MKPVKNAHRIVNLETGEILDNVAHVWVRKYEPFQQNHITMFQDALIEVSKLNLTKEELQVFNYLLGKALMGNTVIIPFKDAAKEIGILRPNYSRAVTGLAQCNIIVKGEEKVGHTPSLRINYGIAWKGKRKDYKVIKLHDQDRPLQNKKGAPSPQLTIADQLDEMGVSRERK